MTTDTSIHLGADWDGAQHLVTQALWFVPRIGETIEFTTLAEGAVCKVLDVKHLLVDEVQCVEVLVWPSGSP